MPYDGFITGFMNEPVDIKIPIAQANRCAQKLFETDLYKTVNSSGLVDIN